MPLGALINFTPEVLIARKKPLSPFSGYSAGLFLFFDANPFAEP
jgi:hypothetical protein